jgi:hypothetical protein
MENGCKNAPKKDVIICKRQNDSNSGVETITPKKMLKIYENLNTFQCFSEFVIRDAKVKITIRPPEEAFRSIKEFLEAVELKFALNSISYLSVNGKYMCRIKISAIIYEQCALGGKVPSHYTYNIRMLNDFNFECSDGMTSEKILYAEVKKIEKLVIIGGIHGSNRVLVSCNK